MALFGSGFPGTRLSGGSSALCGILGEAVGIQTAFTVGSDDFQRAVRLGDAGELDVPRTIAALIAISAASSCRGSAPGPQRLAQSVGNGVVPEPADPLADSRVSRLPTRWRSAAAEGLSHIGLS